ncbi:SufS family cysteine desulfurase [Pseudostreptobacillus hongkongensis]|uniref:SufS family cysteine desulfurase n=1 Tax=Pseudostreptobacillus hongkongensis TaxID=1162717 RepID=UPI0028D706C5|nr:SufS family cysteine desulfurase [Pseudostreptobacillus hongkongensis]
MENIKNKFPIFNNKDIHYLDTAATSQKPESVIESIKEYYENENGNAGRGTHELALLNSAIVETTRKKIADFVGVSDPDCIVYTKNTTESLNILAFSYAMHNLKEGDEVILAISNHHANIVPWLEVAKIKNIRLRYVYLDKDGNIDIDELMYILNSKTKIVSISAVVNSTGVIQNFKDISKMSHSVGAKFILDCAQSMIHFKHEFEKWDVDFAVFSGHKMFASQGIGILYGKKELLNITKPFIFGGDMVEYVTESSAEFKEVPHKFEGGTLNISGIKSLSSAIDFIEDIGYDKIEEKEIELMRYLLFSLSRLDFVETYYTETADRVAIVAFNVKGVHSHDVSFILDSYKVMVRSGQHCCAPLMRFMGINSCCRISLSIYNTEEDIDKLIEGLEKVKEVFK